MKKAFAVPTLFALAVFVFNSVAVPVVNADSCALQLSLSIVSGNLHASSGNMQYAVFIKNAGTSTCDEAALSIYYGTNESFVSATPAPSAKGYYWQIGALSPNQSMSISLTTKRSAALGKWDSPTEGCLSADGASDACSDVPVVGSANGMTSAPVAKAIPSTASAASTSLSTPVVTSLPAFTPLQQQTQSTASTPTQAVTLAPAPNTTAGAEENGIWVWTPVSTLSQAQIANTVASAVANHFNAIYLTTDDYLDIDVLPDGPAKTAKLQIYEQALNSFLTLASAQGIAVDAESGWRTWGEASNQWNAYDMMTFVANYNATHAVKFRSVQYDIEPYLLPQYLTDPSDVLTDYVSLVNGLANQARSSGLPLSIIIPHFYDDAIQWTPEVTLNGVTAYPYNQILSSLSGAPNSRIIVMAYRNSAYGTNGTIALSNEEIKEADATGVKVIVAQETGPVTPAYTTFNGMSKTTLNTQEDDVETAFAHDRSFGGMAVDYLVPFLKLK